MSAFQPTAAHDNPVDPSIMRQVGLGLAEGHLGQADLYLTRPPLERQRGYRITALELALQHLRTACGWLISVARL